MAPYGLGCVREVDGVEHAVVRRTLGGDVALCGAGKITLHVIGDFDPRDRYACPACAHLVTQESGTDT